MNVEQLQELIDFSEKILETHQAVIELYKHNIAELRSDFEVGDTITSEIDKTTVKIESIFYVKVEESSYFKSGYGLNAYKVQKDGSLYTFTHEIFNPENYKLGE